MQVLDAAPRPRISLLHATRGRPLQAAQNMNLWITRASKPESVEHIFAVDSDDESAALLQRFAGVCQGPDGFSVCAWNLAAQHSTGDILVQFSDDFETTADPFRLEKWKNCQANKGDSRSTSPVLQTTRCS
jgi:hypothetical protein